MPTAPLLLFYEKSITEHMQNWVSAIKISYFWPNAVNFSSNELQHSGAYIRIDMTNCGNSLEMPCWGMSYEYPQFMFWWRNK